MLSDTLVYTGLPPGTFIGKVNVTDEATDNSYTLKLTCDSVPDGPVWVKSYFLAGDSLKTGRVFSSSYERTDTVFISLTDRYNNKLSKAITLSIGSIATNLGPEKRFKINKYFIYPNPVGDMLYLDENLPPGLSEINIFSLTGEKVRVISITGYNRWNIHD